VRAEIHNAAWSVEAVRVHDLTGSSIINIRCRCHSEEIAELEMFDMRSILGSEAAEVEVMRLLLSRCRCGGWRGSLTAAVL
jgi:hypothetical protein